LKISWNNIHTTPIKMLHPCLAQRIHTPIKMLHQCLAQRIPWSQSSTTKDMIAIFHPSVEKLFCNQDVPVIERKPDSKNMDSKCAIFPVRILHSNAALANS
jgi:hypothetical protein